MSAFAVMVSANDVGCDHAEFNRFLQLAADYKFITEPAECATGLHCCGAKLDTSSSLHRGITHDPETGSWLLAAGTVIDASNVAPDGSLLQLLKDYLSHGPAVFARCDGLFALVIYNGLTQRTAVVSDPFGYFSVFYGSRGGQTFVSTSGLAVAQQIGAIPDELGVNCFLRTGKVFGEMTLWQDVKRLLPGTVLELSPQHCRTTIYWQPTVDPTVTSLSFDQCLEASLELLQQVIDRNLSREGKLWTDLTGGFDTRFLVMLLKRVGIPFKANFVGPAEHADVKIARQIVAKMKWDYQHFELPPTWPQDCPAYLHDALGRGDGHLNVFLSMRALWVHKQERQQYPALLSGLGGEMWRGPIWWPEGSALGKSSEVHYDRQLWSFMHPIAESIFIKDSSRQVKDEVTAQFTRIGEREPEALNTVKLDYLWTYRETAHVGVWASVAAGLVRIIPALFSKDIVSHVISVDPRWKMKNLLVKSMFERYEPVLAHIEVEGRGPAVPQRLTNFYRFIPSRLAFYRKAANKFVEIKFGKSLWPAQRYEGFSRLTWRQEMLKHLEAEGLFQPASMRSGKLYNFDELQTFLSQAKTETFSQDEFLGRLVTVEMALRAVNSAIQ